MTEMAEIQGMTFVLRGECGRAREGFVRMQPYAHGLWQLAYKGKGPPLFKSRNRIQVLELFLSNMMLYKAERDAVIFDLTSQHEQFSSSRR